MLPAGEPFTVGVEEEFQIVDAGTRELRPRSAPVLASARDLGDAVQPELTAAQVETVSPVCETLADVRRELTRLRARVMAAAVANGSRIAALGTHPVTDWLGQGVFPRERYETLAEDYQHLALEQQICGFHVHVCVRDAEAAIAVIDRVRPWLAPLLALTGNSPYWQALDTGYASYRSVLFDRWPLTGTPPLLGSRSAYDALVADLVAAGVVPDASKIYWELRPSARFDTVEFRTADVCLTVDEAVMVAGLTRGLVRTAYAELRAGVPVAQPHPELLRAARWRAARYGLQGPLIDVTARRSVHARDRVAQLLAHVEGDLRRAGEYDEVAALVDATLAGGNGAQRQRAAFERWGDLRRVVDVAVAATAPAPPLPDLVAVPS